MHICSLKFLETILAPHFTVHHFEFIWSISWSMSVKLPRITKKPNAQTVGTLLFPSHSNTRYHSSTLKKTQRLWHSQPANSKESCIFVELKGKNNTFPEIHTFKQFTLNISFGCSEQTDTVPEKIPLLESSIAIAGATHLMPAAAPWPALPTTLPGKKWLH